MDRDNNVDVEEFKKQFWEQFPIEGTVKFDGHLIMRVIQEIEGLEDKCRAEGMWPY